MSISQTSFLEKNSPVWRRFDQLLNELDKKYQAVPAHEFPALYRQLCVHLSIARHRGYSSSLVDTLNGLVERGHAVLYGSRIRQWDGILAYASGGFARQVRAEWRLTLLATLLFVVPALGMFWWLIQDPSWTYHVIGPRLMAEVEAMYAQSTSLRLARTSESDILMFGYYIRNNTGIALRTFGSGLFFGLGSFFILAFNGIFMGAVAGHLHNAGLAQNLWTFVIGHSSLELTAIVLAGMTGFKIGFAPIWPGPRTRLVALRKAARQSIGLIAGFSVMLFMAAFIEAFWSASSMSPPIKMAVGILLWGVVFLYFALTGRAHGSE